MKSICYLVFLIVPTSTFLLEGLGLGLPRQQCCCPPLPPPPPPCGGGGGEYVGNYEGPPPPPPYATGYPGPYKHRQKRSTKPANLEASSGDLFCNSVQVRDIIKQGMNNDEKTSRETITTLLKTQLEREYVVICSKNHFDFLASTDSEFCSVTKEGLTCSTFVF
ncbi:unnamed protein product [Caenorhabditis angaria]|uniref:Ground-like domain-containing protein n=1 Tax=Caenorhabditis angaria TaxID=860376 RepID=A0A9P1IPJ3_9PELO|nr:unnamed protein product [Caenorhabditis angaria]